MSEIRFYHLQTQGVEQALPQILAKALSTGRRVLVKSPSGQDVEKLNEALWTYRAESFLPHGSAKDGYEAGQPVFLTDGDDNPNKADVLVLTGGASHPGIAGFALCCEMFDGRDESAVEASRARWQRYKDEGHALTYWQQNPAGGWDKKS